jgi:hypothetical protein
MMKIRALIAEQRQNCGCLAKKLPKKNSDASTRIGTPLKKEVTRRFGN